MPQMIYKKSFRLCAHIFLSPQRCSSIPKVYNSIKVARIRKEVIYYSITVILCGVIHVIKDMHLNWNATIILLKSTLSHKALCNEECGYDIYTSKYSNLFFLVWSLYFLIKLQAWKAEYRNEIQEKSDGLF